MATSSLMAVASLREAALQRIQLSCYQGLSPDSATAAQKHLEQVDSGARKAFEHSNKRIVEQDAHTTPEEKVRKTDKSPVPAESQVDGESQNSLQEAKKVEMTPPERWIESQWREEGAKKPPSEEQHQEDSLLLETDSEEMKARNKNTEKMKKPAAKAKTMKRPAAASAPPAASEAAEAAVESAPKAKSQPSKGMKKPAAVSKTPSASGGSTAAGPGEGIGGKPLSTSMFPNADARYTDEGGDWEAGLGNNSFGIHFQI